MMRWVFRFLIRFLQIQCGEIENVNLGPETERIEFKLCALKVDYRDYLDEDSVNDILHGYVVETNQYDYLQRSNFEKMFSVYVTKYMSVFGNMGESGSAEMYFGVSDEGNVVGFPYFGDFENYFRQNIISLLWNVSGLLRIGNWNRIKITKYLISNLRFSILKVNDTESDPDLIADYEDKILRERWDKLVYDSVGKSYVLLST